MTWPRVPLGEILRPVSDPHRVRPDFEYPNIGMYSFGRGIFRKPSIRGAATSATTLYRIRAGQFIYSRLFAFEGAYGYVSDAFDGSFVSNEYPNFSPIPERVNIDFLSAYFRRPAVWEEIAKFSTGMGDRRRRIQPEQFLKHEIPLPSLAEQRRIVARIEELAAQIVEAQSLREEIGTDLDRMIASAHWRIAELAPRMPLGEVAPLLRRPVGVKFDESYPQVAVRSFGRGTFHKPPLVGSEVTWEKPFLVEAGDILVSNIKAWEGALAVARPEDGGRVGSHRYLTCVPKSGVATARFVCFYLLSPEGLHDIGEASPGSADRNRTLNAKAFIRIPVPVPQYEDQLWFDSLCQEVEVLRPLQAEAAAELVALNAAVLDRAFCGEL